VLTNPHGKNWPCYETGYICPGPGLILRYNISNETGDIRFGKWNVRNLCRSGSLTTPARELARYTLDLVDVQEVRWKKGVLNYMFL
jgi:hypothetical protein